MQSAAAESNRCADVPEFQKCSDQTSCFLTNKGFQEDYWCPFNSIHYFVKLNLAETDRLISSLCPSAHMF
jgi:hypothetical protein